MGIECAKKILCRRESPTPRFTRPAAWANVGRQLTLIHPDRPPGAGIQGEGRGHLAPVAYMMPSTTSGVVSKLSGGSGLVNPLRHYGVRVHGVDLIEGR